MNQSKKLTDGALLLAIFIVLLFITIFITPIAIFSAFFLPLPFIMYASRHGFKPSIIFLIAAVALTALFFSIFSIFTPILMGLGGIMIGTAIRKDFSAYEALARGTFGFIIGLLFLYAGSQVLFGVNWIGEFRTIFTESVEMSTELAGQFTTEEQIDQFESTIQTYITYMTNLIPVFLIMAGFILALISQWIGFKFLNRLDKRELRFPPFRTLRFPKTIIWVYFIALLLSFFVTDTSSMFFVIIQNAQVLLGAVLVIQGFSLIFFYTHHKKISKAIPVLFIILTILFPPFLLPFIRILGIIDIGMNLRDTIVKKR
ncbi:DUF2232 domain-containing protein [Oceanobacillus piezotolerans]|uniref:DUF2232 domain-containing protein n=1 Tax=Oceanobacillus piezotolerans TaxID=2448030 RepID=A0A498D5K8_9BACI|nr:YybS family protein [Oceanobacillus piezotolerans]RLL41755.1 DUF2232 domain-containing protein [Oceanobacillus piezotolerans]